MHRLTYGYRVSGIGYRGRVGIALVSGVALLTAACGGGEHAAEAVAPRDPITVQVQAVTKAPRAAMVDAGGLVQAKTTAVVTSRLMAPVREVRVAPGDQVRAGQVLVVLDDRDLGAQARSAQSAALAAEQSVTAGGADRQAAEAGLALAKASHARVVVAPWAQVRHGPGTRRGDRRAARGRGPGRGHRRPSAAGPGGPGQRTSRQ